jgi:hypothetical protein
MAVYFCKTSFSCAHFTEMVPIARAQRWYPRIIPSENQRRIEAVLGALMTEVFQVSLTHIIGGIAGALILALLALLLRIGTRLGFPVLFRVAVGATGTAPFARKWKTKYLQKEGAEAGKEIELQEEIELQSAGQLVWGYSTCHWNESGKERSVNYSIVGLHGDRTLVATYVAEDPLSADRGVFLVTLNKDGTEAAGKISGYQRTKSDFVLESNDYKWEQA